MPAYNAAKTLKQTYLDIPPALRKHTLLVDDHSSDNTASVARKLGIPVFVHKKNLGYGGNQKTCYAEALKLHPTAVAMLHPDYQYSATHLTQLVQPIIDGECDFVFGSRIAGNAHGAPSEMPKLKLVVNKVFTVLQNRLLGVQFSEHFSGFRAYSGKLLHTVPFQSFSNDFLFDIQMTMSALTFGFKIHEIPIPTRYEKDSSQMGLRKGIKFILETLMLMLQFVFHQLGLVKSQMFAD